MINNNEQGTKKKFKLRKHISILFMLIIMFSIFMVYEFSNFFILDRFNTFIEKSAQNDMTLVINLLNTEIKDLKSSVKDYSKNSDTFQFVMDRNSDFLNSDFSNKALELNKWNAVYIYDKDKKLIYSKEYDLQNNIELTKDHELTNHFEKDGRILSEDKDNAFIVKSGNKNLIVISQPIRKSTKSQESIGTLVCTREIDQDLIKSFVGTYLITLKVDKDNSVENPLQYTYLDADEGLDSSVWLDTKSGEYKINGSIFDYNGTQLLKLTNDIDETIFSVGKIGIFRYVITISIVLFIFFGALLMIINKRIFKRLEMLIYTLVNIDKSNDFSKRIKVENNDEISDLENRFNNLLETVEKTQSEILYQAKYDQLTDTLNRGAFFDEVQGKLINRKMDSITAIIFIDLDGFKEINDSLGHNAGDLVLVNVSSRLKEALRGYDAVISRFGGDEFVLFIQGIKSYEELQGLCTGIINKVNKSIRVIGNTCSVSCSAGVSIATTNGDKLDELVNNADMAMYKIKRENKNAYCIYNEEMRNKISADMMGEALKNNEYELHYQKQVDSFTGKARGVEALIRWNSPERGMVSPLEFIPLAEETGFIGQLGKWVLQEACRQCKEWNDKYDPNFKVSVNVSSIHFMQKDFINNVIGAIKITGVNSSNLELEITESVALYQEEEVISRLNELKKLDINVDIDDFGTGYSSLKYLQKFQIDGLKIDKAFIDDITENSTIARAIIGMAANLNVHVIAEGVETLEQVDYLKKLGCRYIQGYYYSKPIPAKDVDFQ